MKEAAVIACNRTRQPWNPVPTHPAGLGGSALATETGELWVSGFGRTWIRWVITAIGYRKLALTRDGVH